MRRRKSFVHLAGALILLGAGCAASTNPGGGEGGEGGDDGTGGATPTGGKAGSTGGKGGGSATGGVTGTGGASATGGKGGDGTGGNMGTGGMVTKDAGTQVEAGPKPDTMPAGDGGPPVNAEVEMLCSPMVTLDNQFPNTTGGMRFTKFVPDIQATMQELSRRVCRYIFRNPADVRRNAKIAIVIDAHDGVANAGGGTIHFSSTYIGKIGGGDAAISFEIHGVLGHEVTHLWQYNNGGGALVEAMADYSRFRVGYDKISRRGTGGNWSDPYTVGGFFIVWVEDKYDKDWGYKVNMGMKQQGFNYANFIQQTFGKSANQLWAEYQADIK